MLQPEDSCDSYADLNASRAVITTGSTIGFEASFVDVPNAVVGTFLAGCLGASAIINTSRELQDFVGDMFCRPVYHAWLRSAMLSGALKLTKTQYAEVQNPMWAPRGWRYVDPQKEIGADVEGLANGIKTLTGVLAEQGIDIIDHFETLKHEKELAASYGLELNYVSKVTVSEQADPNGEPIKDTKNGYVNGHDAEELLN